MTMLDVVILVAAGVIVAAMVCRLNALHIREHRLALIVLHVALAAASFSAGVHAWEAGSDLQDLCVVLAAGAWIVHSLPGWREMMRPWADTAAQPLGRASLRGRRP